MTLTLARRRLALFALFFVPGIGLSSWVTRTPAIRDALDASTAEMGLVLFGLSVGSMIGILSSGPLVTRLATRPVIVAGTISIALALPVIGLGAFLGLPLLVAVGLGMFGLGMGGGEVAMNVDGAEVERGIGRPVLPSLHGCFSLGTVIGATAGIGFTALEVPVLLHLGVVGGICAVLLAAAVGSLARGVGLVSAAERAAAKGAPRPALWRDRGLVLIGLIVLTMALAEGTANDWLPLIMVDGHGFDPALGSAFFALFAAAMTIGRFSGGPLIERFGRPAVLATSAVAVAAGIAVVSFVDAQPAVVVAVVLWGLGASLGFPVAISAAGDSGPNGPARVALAATLGYLAFLVGPPALGLLGEEFGLRTAVLLPAVLVFATAFITGATRTRTPATSEH